MLMIKPFNYNIEEEWKFVRDVPIEENGMTNSLHGISRREFEDNIIPDMIKNAKGENLPYWKVPETILFLWCDDNIVGMYRVRHFLNEELKKGAGQISFCIGKEYRGKGYATEGLGLTLDFARSIVSGDEFYLTANAENPASIKVMLKNGGKIIKKEGGKVYVTIANPGRPQIHLEKVSPENWRMRYKICEEQRRYVSDSTSILARAWAYREHNSDVRIIYADDVNIGIVLFYDIEELQAYAFSQILIDCRYQHRGFGVEATKQVLDILEKDGRYNKVVLCYVEGNEAARKMYEGLGFRYTGDSETGEIILMKVLRDKS